MNRAVITCAIAAGAIGMAGSANAVLVFDGQVSTQGAGLGAVNTVLTMQSPGNSTVETASVGRALNSTEDVISGDAKTGASQTQTLSLESLGITSASDLRVVFNPSEPGSSNKTGINLQDLQLNIYSPTGTVLFNSGAFNPVSFAQTGNSGMVFKLDAATASVAQAAAFGPNSQGNLIGLSATANNAEGGFESFQIMAAAVPEPATYGLLAAGLLAIGLAVRRRQPLNRLAD